MPMAVAPVVVACPNCQAQFADWWRPMLNPSIDVSAEQLEAALPSTCPACHAPLDWEMLEEHDGVFSVERG